jgi:hypothetical protein
LDELWAVRQGNRFNPSAGSQMLHKLALTGGYHFFAFSPISAAPLEANFRG